MFNLDIDAFSRVKTKPELSDIILLGDFAHALVGLTFESLITDNMREYLGGKPR